ncbi:hypothetical protein ACFL1H_04665 [Nanoarchaeota archaeon]
MYNNKIETIGFESYFTNSFKSPDENDQRHAIYSDKEWAAMEKSIEIIRIYKESGCKGDFTVQSSYIDAKEIMHKVQEGKLSGDELSIASGRLVGKLSEINGAIEENQDKVKDVGLLI